MKDTQNLEYEILASTQRFGAKIFPDNETFLDLKSPRLLELHVLSSCLVHP